MANAIKNTPFPSGSGILCDWPCEKRYLAPKKQVLRMLARYNSLLAIAGFMAWGCASAPTDSPTQTEITAERHYLHGCPSLAGAGLVNAVIEIPAGTSAKWEVEKNSGNLVWELAGDSLRVVDYLPYPANYGMIPQTLLPKALGGDGDPLDVIVLGPAIERGRIAPCKIIGMLALLDNGEQDNKLLAVAVDSHFATVDDIVALDSL